MPKSSSKLHFRPARPDELQVDLDRPRARISKRLLRLVSEHIKIKSVKYSKSKSGNTHVVIKLGVPLPADCFAIAMGAAHRSSFEIFGAFQKILLQLALGSDPVRELLSWGRARNGCPYPTLFFEEKK